MIANWRCRTRTLLVIISIFVGTLACGLAETDICTAGPYLDSAHGSSLDGVNRPRTASVGYAQGNCAHCHEQHASIEGEGATPHDYALFYPWITICDLFCYRCHTGLASPEQQVGNYPYSVNFGGAPEFYEHIRQQFCHEDSTPANCGSRHHLGAIRNFISNDANGWSFPADADPCSGCHNAHLAQRNYPVQIDQNNKLKTAISRPSDHNSLWGDDESERMMKYDNLVVGIYQAPFYGSFESGQYEPTGDTTYNGSNLPDYVTFCLDCHQYQQYDPERGATVKPIDWSSNGDRHGAYPANTCEAGAQGSGFEGTLRPPYDTHESGEYNYILSCTDCHEPHGTKRRLHLIRRWINGEVLDPDVGTCDDIEDWVEICERCHNVPHPTWGECGVCHGHGLKWSGLGDCNGEPNF